MKLGRWDIYGEELFSHWMWGDDDLLRHDDPGWSEYMKRHKLFVDTTRTYLFNKSVEEKLGEGSGRIELDDRIKPSPALMPTDGLFVHLTGYFILNQGTKMQEGAMWKV